MGEAAAILQQRQARLTAPPSRFLVTGLPRIRSAWFAALFVALGVNCCHDWSTRFDSLETLEGWLKGPILRGWCDPSAACIYPEFASRVFQGSRVVVIERDPTDSLAALERWSGVALPRWSIVVANIERFGRLIDADVLTVSYADLDRYGVVAAVVRHCCGIGLSHEMWSAFDLLKVEQHMSKARALWTAAA